MLSYVIYLSFVLISASLFLIFLFLYISVYPRILVFGKLAYRSIAVSGTGIRIHVSGLLSFSGYHQIFMKKSDEEKTSFTTPFGTHCYVRMPEGLRNAGSTFYRTIGAVLGSQLDRNISAYVDNVVVRSKKRQDHIQDLRETFANLHKHGLKLNPEKCVFGVR